jgi:hypothetical protein
MEVLDYQFSTSLRVSTLPIAQVDSISVALIWVNGRRTSALPKHDQALPFFRLHFATHPCPVNKQKVSQVFCRGNLFHGLQVALTCHQLT